MKRNRGRNVGRARQVVAAVGKLEAKPSRPPRPLNADAGEFDAEARRIRAVMAWARKTVESKGVANA